MDNKKKKAKPGPNDVRLPDRLMATLKWEARYSKRTVRQIVIAALEPIAKALREQHLLRLEEAAEKLGAYFERNGFGTPKLDGEGQKLDAYLSRYGFDAYLRRHGLEALNKRPGFVAVKKGETPANGRR